MAKRDIRKRVKRLTLVVGAYRTISPALADEERPDGIEERLGQVRDWLSELQEAGSSVDPALEATLLEKVDGAVGELANKVRACAAGAAVGRMHDALRVCRQGQRDGLIALLELCLLDSEGPRRWRGLLEYVVTLLASVEQDGVWEVDKDPTALSTRFESLCGRALEDELEASAGLAATLEDAMVQLEKGAQPDEIAERTRALKQSAGNAIWVPDVLRAVVGYNIALANRWAELGEDQRGLEAEVLGVSNEVLEAAPIVSLPPAEGEAGPVADSGPLGEIADALRERLDFRSPPATGTGEIAQVLQLSKVAPFEKSAFLEPEGESYRSVVRLAVTVGLMLRELPELATTMIEVGLHPDHVRAWLPELEEGLQEASEALIAENNYADARKVSELRSRFLEPDEEAGPSAWSFERTDEEAEYAGATAPRKTSQSTSTKPKRTRKPGRLAPWREIAMACALVLSVGSAAGLQLWIGGGGNVELYSGESLSHLSPYLESGYRDGEGQGPTFIGRLDDSWKELSPERRQEVSSELIRNLEMQGVKRVMLFDKERRLRLNHSAQGP